MKKILIITFAVLAAISCKKDETIRYNNITMGNIDGQTIISDQGNTFDIAESVYEFDFSEYEYGRVILSCDVLKKTADKRYDIRLTGMASVLTKETVKASTITPESEASVSDHIIIKELWYGGGYINMLVQFARKKDSEKKHIINLVYDDLAVTDGEGKPDYSFILRHNAVGETPDEESRDEYTRSTGYASFPVSSLITEDKAKISFTWNATSFKNGRFDYTAGEETTRTFDWERIGYEHKISAPDLLSPVCIR